MIAILLLLLTALPAAAAPSAKTLPESSPKYQTLKKVFDRLARVVERVPPQLYLLQADNWDEPAKSAFGADPLSPLRVNEQGKFVVMDASLLDTFADTFPSQRERDNALAFVIGHELAHYANRQSGGLAGDEKEKKDRKKAEELADRKGAWYAGEAGYEPFPAAEQALRTIYEKYRQGKPNLEGYPTLQERIRNLHTVRDELAGKLPFLNAAELLLAIGRPLEAARLFEHVARDYTSLGTLNNAAVANALASLALRPRSPFFYPFELETNYRFKSRSKGAEADEDQEAARSQLLNKAATLLEKAILLDNGYVTTLLNRAAVADLQGDSDTVRYRLGQAEKIASADADRQTLSRIAVLKGIALAKSGKRKEAADLFTAVRPEAESMAVTNLMAIDADIELPPPASIPDDAVAETINNFSPINKEIVVKIRGGNPLLLNDEYGGNVTINLASNKEWLGFRVRLGSHLTVTTITTPEGYAAPSKRGVRVGDSEAAVTGRYGRPNRIIATRQGTLLAYSQDSVIFSIGRDGRVAGWKIYTVEGT
jgi:hypothetical protein